MCGWNRSGGTICTVQARAVLELPDQFHRKLNLTGSGLSRGKKSGALNALSFLIEDRKVVSWRRKIRAVEDVEDLRSELGVETF